MIPQAQALAQNFHRRYDICCAVDELARFLIKANKYTIFEYSFKLWAERKCSWARTMLDGIYSASIEEIMRKYKLNDKE